ncbi:sigma-E factor negative regulatory protein [Aestuariibacter sp. A3R04]|uniref:sigma-E factor negative regulatory protein n=1 Tax=Aestuariibacter sp. A3R04 TaxID=2841571 RepID=UPI001C08A67D|nr:RseA family anti-sigma factor [Aestuariibacter sp. A3R04]MBU3021876.1 transcriptional regulator [Aestuariibacter sp. A3R04]
MTQQQEKLSAFMDGETHSADIMDDILRDEALKTKWQRYHVIRSGLRKEATVAPNMDITAAVAEALADEPTVMAPKPSRWRSLPLVGNVVPFAKQGGQFAVAASVAVAVVLGVQQMNKPEATEPFSTFETRAQFGGMAPVSLEQTRTLPRNDMDMVLEKKRKINALIADHEQQVKLKQAEEELTSTDKTEDTGSAPN